MKDSDNDYPVLGFWHIVSDIIVNTLDYQPLINETAEIILWSSVLPQFSHALLTKYCHINQTWAYEYDLKAMTGCYVWVYLWVIIVKKDLQTRN